MSLASKKYKCTREVHLFDLETPGDLIVKTCRCGKKVSNFRGASLDRTIRVKYNTKRMLKL